MLIRRNLRAPATAARRLDASRRGRACCSIYPLQPTYASCIQRVLISLLAFVGKLDDCCLFRRFVEDAERCAFCIYVLFLSAEKILFFFEPKVIDSSKSYRSEQMFTLFRVQKQGRAWHMFVRTFFAMLFCSSCSSSEYARVTQPFACHKRDGNTSKNINVFYFVKKKK